MRTTPLFFIKAFILVSAVSLLVVYSFVQARPFLSGPEIFLEHPINGQVFDDFLLKIEGTASGSEIFSINDRVVLTDSRGGFEESLLLAKGYNIIELSAEDRFGKIATKKLEVFLK